MPSLELRVDNRYFRIDSADQEMCGRWLMDCLMLYPITPATYLQLRVMPFFLPHPTDPSGQVQEVADWTCDSRKLNVWANVVSVKSPAEAARKFAAQITQLASMFEPEPEDAKPAEEET